MRADESVRPAQASDILAASSVAAEPLVNFLKGPWVINPRDKVTGVLHPPRLPSGPTGVKRIPYHGNSSLCNHAVPSEWHVCNLIPLSRLLSMPSLPVSSVRYATDVSAPPLLR